MLRVEVGAGEPKAGVQDTFKKARATRAQVGGGRGGGAQTTAGE